MKLVDPWHPLEKLAGWALGLILVSGLVVAIADYHSRPVLRTTPLSPAVDARFVAIGHAYPQQLAKAYAAAWDQGAKQLDAGATVSAALDAVGKAWTSKRTELYDQVVTPALSAILPESTADADVTPAERAALAAAFRGLARGLSP